MAKSKKLTSNQLTFWGNKKNRSRVYWVAFFIFMIIMFVVNNGNENKIEGPYPPDFNQSRVNLQQAPDFTLNNFGGGTTNLADYRGNILIIDFWATWCAPCKKSFPELVELKNEYADKNFEILSINIDEFTKNSGDKVKPFINKFNVNFPVLEGTPEVIKQFDNLKNIPASFIISPDGKIFSKFDSYVPKGVYKREIEKML